MTMKRTLLISCCLGALALPLLACSPSPSPTSIPISTNWQQTVDALNALNPGGIPEHLQQVDAVRDGTEFDPNRYFTVLTHLSMEAGYVLDYVYYYDGMGGMPMLYARPADQAPYENYAAYSAAVGNLGEQRSSYLEHVRTDGTAEGFFELVVLSINGGQFYLFWHANYNDVQVVCDRDRMEGIVAALQASDNLPLSDDALQEVRAIDYAPVVEFAGDTVRVRIITFSMWAGFSEEIYILDREFPHQFRDVEYKVLVPYDCGIMF
jgi:hypothetical protein